MLKVNQEDKKVVMAKDLKPGQLAVIIEDFNDYKGRIVQKFHNDLVSIGLESGNGWVGGANTVSLKVRILEEGETLIITNNQ